MAQSKTQYTLTILSSSAVTSDTQSIVDEGCTSYAISEKDVPLDCVLYKSKAVELAIFIFKDYGILPKANVMTQFYTPNERK